MKKVFLTLVIAVASTLMVAAQDIITKTDGTAIKAKVTEISESAVKYQRYDNLSGPVYTIQIASISSIKYENGAVDNFNVTSNKVQNLQQQNTQSTVSNMQEQAIQDNQLIGLYGLNYSNPEKYYRNAKTLKWTAWIGGVAFAVAGVLIGKDVDGTDGEMVLPMGVGVGLGAIWCTSFLIASNKQKQKFNKAVIYSSSIIEGDFYDTGNARLSAGVNLIGDKTTNEQTLGLGFKFNF